MKYCPYCMSEMEDAQICPKCGLPQEAYQAAVHHLPPGTMLAGRYYVGRALGEGGFGITYLGWDTRLGMKVAVKEYYPSALANRYAPGSLTVSHSQNTDSSYSRGKEYFLQEAQAMARMEKQKEIVGVRDFFEENDTAYIIMEYVSGPTLKARVTQQGPIPAQELLELMRPLMRSLQTMHEAHLIHRDISPDNLMIENGVLRLLDFGCAREIAAGDETMTVMLKHGFSPIEQYQQKGQGPWTDVYALSATIYYCLTGTVPQSAVDRMIRDELVPPRQLGAELTPEQEAALLQGMQVQKEGRFQSVKALMQALYGEKPGSAKGTASNTTSGSGEDPGATSEKRGAPDKRPGFLPAKWRIPAVAAAAVLVVLAAVLLADGSGKKEKTERVIYGTYTEESEEETENTEEGSGTSGTSGSVGLTEETEEEEVVTFTNSEGESIAATAYAFYVEGDFICEDDGSTLQFRYDEQTQINTLDTLSNGTVQDSYYVYYYQAEEDGDLLIYIVDSADTDGSAGLYYLESYAGPEDRSEEAGFCFRSIFSDYYFIIYTEDAYEEYVGALSDMVYGSYGDAGEELTWWFNQSTGVLTIFGVGEMTDYSDNYQDRPWQDYASEVKAVVVREGVTSIGGRVFYDMEAMESISLPESLAAIGDQAIYLCSNLTELTIPAGVTSLADSAFGRNSGLSEVEVETGNTAYVVENGVLYSADGSTLVFCTRNVTGSFAVPESVTKIGGDAFYCCSGLTDITIPEGVTEIGSGAFAYCTGLTKVVLPDGLVNIESSAFYSCENLAAITISSSVTKIGAFAFLGCKNLTAIMIPSGVTEIGTFTFYGCKNLAAITIPSSVTAIGSYAFYGCSALASVSYEGDWSEVSIDSYNEELLAVINGDSEYILPDSDSRYLTEEDLEGLSASELRLARNEIYARHGRIFLDEELTEYFSQFDWYTPTIEPEDFTDDLLNEYEIANIKLIQTAESEL